MSRFLKEIRSFKFKRFIQAKRIELFFVFIFNLSVVNVPVLILDIAAATLISLSFEWKKFRREIEQ